MKNIHSFDQWINEAEATQATWSNGLGDIPGLERQASTKSPMISWKLSKGGKMNWRLMIREKDGKMQVAVESLDPQNFATVTKIHNDLMKELKPITLSSEPFDKVSGKSILPSGKAEENAGYGLIEIDPKNVAKAFAGAKKVIAKYPDATKA